MTEGIWHSMQEASTQPQTQKRRRCTARARVPNEELRWFICSGASELGLHGSAMEGYSSHGTPDSCPYKDRQLGYGKERGDGKIERVRECERTWHAIGSEHRDVLAAYYGTREPGRLDTPDGSERVGEALQGAKVDAVVIAMRVPADIMRTKGMRLELAGVAMLLRARGEKAELAAKSLAAVRIAHEVWTIERDQVDRASAVRWKTGVL